MNTLDGKKFWMQIDTLNPYKSVKMLMEKSSIDYNTIKKQRSELRFPKVETIVALANELNCSLDFLLQRKFEDQKKVYPKRINIIADKLCNVYEQDLVYIERSVQLLPIKDISKPNAIS